MKKIKRIGGLVAIFLFSLYNICFADLVMSKDNIKNHGMRRTFPTVNLINYILVGILVLVIVICAVIIIKKLIEKKKEKSNDDNK